MNVTIVNKNDRATVVIVNLNYIGAAVRQPSQCCEAMVSCIGLCKSAAATAAAVMVVDGEAAELLCIL